MAEFRLDEIATRTGGEIVRGEADLVLRGFGIDSRLIRPGDLFFAIRDKRNGHDFVPYAAQAGAAGAVVSESVTPPDGRFAIVRVRDTVQALQDLAHEALVRNPVKVIGITGSIGKTTTKEFTATLLESRYRVLKSEGNFNNRLGLALSLLRLEQSRQMAVLEMGMNAAGEIAALTQVAPPDVSVITNIAPVHLQFFNSLDDIASAKKEILDGTKRGGTAVLNADDLLVRKIAAEWTGEKIEFGYAEDAVIRASDVRRLGFDGLSFRLSFGGEKTEVRLPFLSDGYIMNFLAAAGVCRAMSLTLDEIKPRFERLVPSAGRGVLVELENGTRLFDDSYNSNPRALDTALKNLAGLPARRKIAVLADMLELGKKEIEFHLEAGRAAANYGWDVLVAIGPLARYMAKGAADAGMKAKRIYSCETSEEAAGRILSLIKPGDLVLVKGSRGMKTEIVAERLKNAQRSQPC